MRKARVYGWIGLVALLAVHGLISYTAMRQQSVTMDEAYHLYTGLAFNRWQDYRHTPGVGNWGQRWIALPASLDASITAQKPGAGHIGWADTERLAKEFLFGSDQSTERLVRHGRLMVLLASLGSITIVYCWVFALAGVRLALLTAALCSLSPTMLAHSHLMTVDMIGVFFAVASVAAYWRLLHVVSLPGLIVTAVAAAGMVLAKGSGLVGVAALLAILAMRCVLGRSMVVRWRQSFAVEGRGRRALVACGASAAAGLVVVSLIWASYGFRYEAYATDTLPQERVAQDWSYQLEADGGLQQAVGWARQHRLLPEAYLYGIAFSARYAERRIAFLDGDYSTDGFISFFPRAMAYKTSLAVSAFWIMGLAFLLIPRGTIGNGFYHLLPIVIFCAVFALFAMASSINIGHRHVAPLYPLLLTAAALAMGRHFQRLRPARLLASGLVIVMMAETALAWPHYLGYFNPVAGGADQGYRRLSDSSVDWGQDLVALGDWLDEREVVLAGVPTYLAYYGASPAALYGVDLPEIGGIGHTMRNVPVRLEPGLYIVSATMLQRPYGLFPGHWNRRYESIYQALRASVERSLSQGSPGNRQIFADFVEARFARLASYLSTRTPDPRITPAMLGFWVDEESLRAALLEPLSDLPAGHGIRGLGWEMIPPRLQSLMIE